MSCYSNSPHHLDYTHHSALSETQKYFYCYIFVGSLYSVNITRDFPFIFLQSTGSWFSSWFTWRTHSWSDNGSSDHYNHIHLLW